jgi:hypothetical protein
LGWTSSHWDALAKSSSGLVGKMTLAAARPSTPVDQRKSTRELWGGRTRNLLPIGNTPASSAAPPHPRPYHPALVERPGGKARLSSLSSRVPGIGTAPVRGPDIRGLRPYRFGSALPQPQRVKIPDGRAALRSARSGKAGGELDGNSRLELPARNLSRDPRARSKAMAHLVAACHVRRD